MKFSDLFRFRLSAQGEAIKANLKEDNLEVDLASETLEDGRKIEYEALEKGAEVFETSEEEGVEPVLIKDETLVLPDGQTIMTDAEGKITEIKPKEEESETEMKAELSEDQKHLIELASKVSAEDLEKLVDLKKNGWYTIEMSVQDGRIIWADMYTETYETLLSKEIDPVKVELEAEQKKVSDLEAKIIVLQELNDQKNPLKKAVKLESDKPLTPYEIQLNIKK